MDWGCGGDTTLGTGAVWITGMGGGTTLGGTIEAGGEATTLGTDGGI